MPRQNFGEAWVEWEWLGDQPVVKVCHPPPDSESHQDICTFMPDPDPAKKGLVCWWASDAYLASPDLFRALQFASGLAADPQQFRDP